MTPDGGTLVPLICSGLAELLVEPYSKGARVSDFVKRSGDTLERDDAIPCRTFADTSLLRETLGVDNAGLRQDSRRFVNTESCPTDWGGSPFVVPFALPSKARVF